MTTKNIVFALIGGIALILIVGAGASALRGGYAAERTTSTPEVTGMPNTPNQETSPSPTPSTPASATIVARLNESVSALNMTITPLEVVEDSRCPQDVQCIHAGTVRVRVRVTSGLGTSEQVIALNGSMTTEAEVITLISVSPDKSGSSVSNPSNYRFTFQVSRS